MELIWIDLYFGHETKKKNSDRRGGLFTKHLRYPLTCDIVNYNCSSWVSDVTRDEATKTLLSRRVPQLQPNLWCREGREGEIKEEKRKQKEVGEKNVSKNEKWGKIYQDKNQMKKRPNKVRHMGKEQKTDKMLRMQVVNEHQRRQDVWSRRKLNQWSPFTCIQSTLHCWKVFSSKTRKTDGGSKRTGENLCWRKRGKRKVSQRVEAAHWTTLRHHQPRLLTRSVPIHVKVLIIFGTTVVTSRQTKSESNEGKNRIPVTSNTHKTWLLTARCTSKYHRLFKNLNDNQKQHSR